MVFHVAIALDDSLALEANTPPSSDDDPTWSGVSLKGGVRLILLADLLVSTTERCVLRNPYAAQLRKDALDFQRPYIAGLYGSEYSIKVFEEYAKEVAPFLTWLSKLFGYSKGWTSTANDVAAKIGDMFRDRVIKHAPQHKFTFESRTFYCSELVIAILGFIGLLPESYAKGRITPSTLFDQLKAGGWTDVSYTYSSDNAIHEWHTEKSRLENIYLNGIGSAQFWRNHYGHEEMLEPIRAFLDRTDKSLVGYIDLLDRLRGVQPSP